MSAVQTFATEEDFVRGARRKAIYVKWVQEYDTLSWFGRWWKCQRDFVDAPGMRKLAEQSVAEHAEWISRNNPIGYLW